MATINQLDQIISDLESKLQLGAARVQYNGRLFDLKSTDEITKAIAYFQSKKADLAGSGATRQIRLYDSGNHY